MENEISGSSLIDLNQADAATLATLPGIGLKIAERIIQYRQTVHPFEEPIEVVAVPGISEQMYHRWADRVTVSTVGEPAGSPGPTPVERVEPAADGGDMAQTVDETPPGPGPEAIATERRPTKPVRPIVSRAATPAPRVETRPNPPVAATPPPPAATAGFSWWRSCLLLIAGIVGGAVLALLILQAINGTLDMSSHSRVVELNDEITALERQSASLNDHIEGLRGRLNQMEALNGRLQTVETEIQGLEADLQALTEALNTVEAQVAELEGDTTQIETSVEEIRTATQRFDNFLAGLRELLSTAGETGPPATTSTPGAEILVEPTAAGELTATFTPLPSPTETPATPPTATRTPRPTRTATPTVSR